MPRGHQFAVRYRNRLYDAFGQAQATQVFTQTNYYHVVLEALPEVQASPTALQQIFVRSPLTGAQVPLSSFARWSTARPGRSRSATRPCSPR